MNISINPISVEQGKVVEFEIEGFSAFVPEEIGVDLSKVGQDYTEFAMSAGGKPSQITPTISVLLEATRNLPPGLYLLTKMQFRKKGATEVFLTAKEFATKLFEIRSPSSTEQSADQLLARYEAIHRDREKDFLKGMGTGAQHFTVLVFVRDILITMRMRLGQLEVIPFDGLGSNDEKDLIQRFLAQFKIGNISDTPEAKEATKHGQPCMIIHFPLINADSPEEAGRLAEKDSALLAGLLALQRDGAGTIFGSVLIDKSNGDLYHRIITPSYHGNLLGGFISGEEPRTIKHRLQKLRDSDRAKLYAEMFREVLLEQNLEIRWFRFWNILETVARSKPFLGQLRRDWSGAVLLNQNGSPRLIGDHAEQLVFELLRTTLSPRLSDSSFAHGLQQGLLSQQIPIWYRRRNCLVHGGDCLCRNPSLPLNEQKFVNCKMARDEQPNIGTDMYLSSLKDVTKFVVLGELN